MKSAFAALCVLLSVADVLPCFGPDFPTSRVAWPPGAEAIIDQAIAIKVEAQSRSIRFESDG
jgi:hypothetical protein